MKNENRTLFVGTYTDPDFDVVEKGKGIYALNFDSSSGALNVFSVTLGVENPSYMVVDPVAQRLYSVNERMVRGRFLPGAVSAFEVEGLGRLKFLNTVPSEGSCPCHIAFDSHKKNLFAANYVSGTVAHFELEADGRLRGAASVDQHFGSGPTPRQTGPHAHMVTGSRDGRYIYSVDLGADAVFWGRWHDASAGLDPAHGTYKTAPGAGPRHIAFHPVQDRAYLVTELCGTVEVLSVDRETGGLELLQTLATLPAGKTGFAGCSAIRVSPDGRFLYAGNRGDYSTVAVYRIDGDTGALSFIGVCPTGGLGPRDFVIDPSGAYIVIANQVSGTVVSFKLDADSGLLGVKVGQAKVPTPVCLTFL